MSHKYQSIYSDSLITGSQFIAELLIQRKAQKEKVVLPNQFWKDNHFKVWTKEFLKQKRRVDTLQRSGYSIEAILEVLKDKKYSFVYSLFFPKIEDAIHEAERKLKQSEITQEPAKIIEENKGQDVKFGRANKKKNSKKNRLS